MRGIQNYFRIAVSLLMMFIVCGLSAQTLDEARTLYNEGGTAVQEGNIEQGIQKFNECISICEILYEEEEDLDAESLIITIQEKMPKLYYQLSVSKLREKEMNSGLQYAIKSKEAAEEFGDSETLEKAKQLLGKVYYSVGLSKYKAKKYDEALVELDKAIIEDNNLKAHNLKLVILKDKGEETLLIEASKSAIAAAEAASNKEYQQKFVQLVSTYFYNEGVKAKQSSDYDNALEKILISLEFSVENPDAYFLLTSIYNSKSDWDKAIEAANNGLKYEYCRCDSFEELLVKYRIKNYLSVYSGLLMSEYLNRCNFKNLNKGYEYHCLYRHFPNIINSNVNFVLPVLDLDVINIIKKLLVINKNYLRNSFISKYIIDKYNI